jgi:hypothetical protein
MCDPEHSSDVDERVPLQRALTAAAGSPIESSDRAEGRRRFVPQALSARPTAFRENGLSGLFQGRKSDAPNRTNR